MLTSTTLAELAQTLAGFRVLSVYVDGRAPDPARRTEWRRELELGLETLRQQNSGIAHDERAELEQCVSHVEHALAPATGAIGAPGWIGFFTASGTRYAERQPCAVPTLVDWRVGGRLAPSLALVEQGRLMYVAMVDARSATVYRAQAGEIERVAMLHAYAAGGPVLHMGQTPREHFHPGTRGQTGTDAAEAAHRAGREHLYRAMIERLELLAGSDAVVLFGGTPTAVRETVALLPSALERRSCVEPALDIHASESAMLEAARAAGSAFRDARSAALVAAVIDRAGAGAQGTVGWRATRAALAESAVREALVTRAFLKRMPDESETLLRGALAQHAEVALVSGPGAEHLDASAEGVAALLRYSLSAAALRAPAASPELTA